MELTQEILKELMHYDPDTGVFTWHNRDIKWFGHCKYPKRQMNTWNTKNALKVAGTIFKTKNKKYYTTSISLNKQLKRYYMHSIAFMYVLGYIPKEIDHIDGNGLNNKIKNICDKSHCDNLKNQKMRSTNTSGFNGVWYEESRRKWCVSVWHKGKRVFNKRFGTYSDAVSARIEQNKKYGYYKDHGRRT